MAGTSLERRSETGDNEEHGSAVARVQPGQMVTYNPDAPSEEWGWHGTWREIGSARQPFPAMARCCRDLPAHHRQSSISGRELVARGNGHVDGALADLRRDRLAEGTCAAPLGSSSWTDYPATSRRRPAARRPRRSPARGCPEPCRPPPGPEPAGRTRPAPASARRPTAIQGSGSTGSG